MNENPFQPPQSSTAAPAQWSERVPNIWVFAIVWPFVSNAVYVVTLPLVSPSAVFRGFLALVPLFGYLVCVVCAARYPASRMTRILRGLASILLLLAFGQVSRIVFGAIVR
jgi:hypothetical protein